MPAQIRNIADFSAASQVLTRAKNRRARIYTFPGVTDDLARNSQRIAANPLVSARFTHGVRLAAALVVWAGWYLWQHLLR